MNLVSWVLYSDFGDYEKIEIKVKVIEEHNYHLLINLKRKLIMIMQLVNHKIIKEIVKKDYD